MAITHVNFRLSGNFKSHKHQKNAKNIPLESKNGPRTLSTGVYVVSIATIKFETYIKRLWRRTPHSYRNPHCDNPIMLYVCIIGMFCLYADRTAAQMFRQGGATRMHVIQDLMPTLRGNVTTALQPGPQLTAARAQIAVRPGLEESTSEPATALPNLSNSTSPNLYNNSKEMDTENLCTSLINICGDPDITTEDICLNLLRGCGHLDNVTGAPNLNNATDVPIAMDFDNASDVPNLNNITDTPVAMSLLSDDKSNQTQNSLRREMRRLKVEEILAFLAVHAMQNKARLRMDMVTTGCAVTLSGLAIILIIIILCRAPTKTKGQPIMELLEMGRSDPTSLQSPSWPESRSSEEPNQE